MFSKRVLALGVSIAALTATVAIPLRGFIIGAGLPVFDGASLTEMLIQSGYMSAQIGIATRTYNKISAQYDHMKEQAKALTGGQMNVYRAVQLVWKDFRASDYYNRNAAWQQAVSVGL